METRGRWQVRNGRRQDGLDQSSSGSNSFAGIGVSRANFPSWIYRFLASGTLLAAMQAMKINENHAEANRVVLDHQPKVAEQLERLLLRFRRQLDPMFVR